MPQAAEVGGRFTFVSLTAFRSVAALIGEWAAWSGDGMRQRQPMRCAILLSHQPSLIPARRPRLYASAVLPVVSHSTTTVCNVCMCLLAQKFVCRCLDKSIETPSSHVSIGGGTGVGERGDTAPLKDSCPSPQSSCPQCQANWHLPWDALNELKEIQWDTWCSSHGTPLLLCPSAQLCPPAQAQRRTHHGTKNTQSATVYQADLPSSPTKTLPRTHSPTSPLQISDFSLLGCIPSDICLIVGMEEIANHTKEQKVICVF